MKRSLAFLMVFCLVLSCCAAAFAAGPVITKQPESPTAEVGGKLTIVVKANNVGSLTWYFINPATGEETTARHIKEIFPNIRLNKTNNKKLVISNVPAEMNGWSLYARLKGNGYSVDTDTVVLTVTAPAAATEAPAVTEAPAETAAPAVTEAPAETAAPAVTEAPAEAAPAVTEAPAEAAPAVTEAPAEAAPATVPSSWTVTVSGLELFELNEEGWPDGEDVPSLTFEGKASVYVKAQEGSVINRLVINGLELIPTAPVAGFTINGLSGETLIEGTVEPIPNYGDESEDAPGSESYDMPESESFDVPESESYEEDPAEAQNAPTEEQPAAEEQPAPAEGQPAPAEEQPAAEAEQPAAAAEAAEDGTVTVTCERCRFSGGGYTFATSGAVPAGTRIVVIGGSEGDLSKGYTINGEAGHMNESSFRIEVQTDTVIAMAAK